MPVAKYQNTITLFLVQCPMKTSPSATLVQDWVFPQFPPNVGLTNTANSQGKLNDKDRVASGWHHSNQRARQCARVHARCSLIQAQWAVDLLNSSFEPKLETLLEGNSLQCGATCTKPVVSGHFIRSVNLDVWFRCALIKRLPIDQREGGSQTLQESWCNKRRCLPWCWWKISTGSL